ncbi:MAG: hypothetical protein H6851_18240 [Geminicoccaceae bacterium]|nr:hypothetical protein [Geminicoccaceae bacterium]MCB9945546.1 hypothetical protein [Geminicoccaceae bacterium]
MNRDLVGRASAYPYDMPLDSFVFDRGRSIAGPFDLVERQPVLAIGSNAAPEQLARKFGTESRPIPVTRVIVKDHTVVFSAHFSRYGSLPATLHEVPGARTYAFITWLDENQLARMHETENVGKNYDYSARDDIEVETESGSLPCAMGFYRSRRGPLLLRSNPVRMAEVASIGAPLPQLTQRAALRHVHSRLAPEHPFETFIARIVEDDGYREHMTERLQELD